MWCWPSISLGRWIPATSPPLTAPAVRNAAQDGEVWDTPLHQEPAGYRLQCIISKRFSNETLLWYCCKEVLQTTVDRNEGNNTAVEEPVNLDGSTHVIAQRYAFWARLAMLGDAADFDLCRYPSQTSVLIRQGVAGWQSLSNPRQIHPPTVELID